jgi:hypothetical protein
MISGELLDKSRGVVTVQTVLGMQAWRGLRYVGSGTYALFSRAGIQKIIVQDARHWCDSLERKVHDSFDLLCVLRGSSEEWVKQEFIRLTPPVENIGNDSGETHPASAVLTPEPEPTLSTPAVNVGTSTETVLAVRDEDVGNGSEVAPANGALFQAKRKSPGDLLELIPKSEPIVQAELESCTRSGYQREICSTILTRLDGGKVGVG